MMLRERSRNGVSEREREEGERERVDFQETSKFD